jgi:4-aminobutyrate aminotransferase-like enzyme
MGKRTMQMLDRLSFADAPVLKTEIPGPKSLKMIEVQDELETSSRSYTRFFKFAIEKARGSTIMDVDGNVFIDWFGGVSVMNLGHGHPAVLDAIKVQLDKISHITEIPTEARIRYLETLSSVLPGNLRGRSKIMLTVTGADACEAAVSLAKYNTKKNSIIAFSGSYHGIAGGIVGATSNFHYREYAGYSTQNFTYVPYPYSYRFPWEARKEDMPKEVVNLIRFLIRDSYSGVPPVGGIIVEPIQGEGGYIVPPDDFLPMLRELCDEYSIPLIVDEVQSGIGRTGKLWATSHSNVTPDIMCISKSIGGGIPVSSIAYRKDFDSIPTGFHLGTYRGNPLGLAAGNAILNIVNDENFLSGVRLKGKRIMKRFDEYADDSNIIGEVRGKGMMIGAELVNDKKSKTPGTELATSVRESMFRSGVLMHTCGHFSNVMRFMAPLTIEDDLIDEGLDIFGMAIRSAGK